MATTLTTTDAAEATRTGGCVFSDLWGYAQRKVNDPDSDLEVLLKEWVNAVDQQATHFGRKPPFLYGSTTVTTTNGTAYVTAPTDMQAISRIGTDDDELRIATQKRIEGQDDTGTPSEAHFNRSEGRIYFWPVPDSATTYDLEYTKEYSKLVNDSDQSLVPAKYLWILYYGIDEHVFRYQGDNTAARDSKLNFMRALVTMLNSEDQGVGSTKMTSTVEAHQTQSGDTIYGDD